ncbi:hypothetical protein CCHOA_00275 [Corynebacterium choanae]|uniref:Uncharacterized protein n=1 Tax=Corynebacterium choanae TaxID=1862358 RepID=A0A3G6J396_9CORY|nr:hypothetical protein CCHOA_00275 [Corynebacterium choanae]
MFPLHVPVSWWVNLCTAFDVHYPLPGSLRRVTTTGSLQFSHAPLRGSEQTTCGVLNMHTATNSPQLSHELSTGCCGKRCGVLWKPCGQSAFTGVNANFPVTSPRARFYSCRSSNINLGDDWSADRQPSNGQALVLHPVRSIDLRIVENTFNSSYPQVADSCPQ